MYDWIFISQPALMSLAIFINHHHLSVYPSWISIWTLNKLNVNSAKTIPLFCISSISVSVLLIWLQIMALLAPIIGKEKTGELFFDRFLELCVNDRYDVRKLCATYCPHLCKVMGIEISEKYLVCNMCLTKEQYFIIVNHFINFIDLCSFFSCVCFKIACHRFQRFLCCAKIVFGMCGKQRPTQSAWLDFCVQISIDATIYVPYYVNWWMIRAGGCIGRPLKA